eukprot:TRINITY_DN16179_c0_g1_i2.p1 TRINITY_DN16179_c0_g1~~TRINITY_DN16179_c0_g1_i2.p1  ORF type:complete len:215 (+),score=19.11 TRINITY_DN16179_c0_g1_i2:160-804(+)
MCIRDRSKGIEQINMAVSQMDKVTQTNAANAEESASASEEMSAQAEQMRSIVAELSKLVTGTYELKSTHSSSRRMKKTHSSQVHHVGGHGYTSKAPAKIRSGSAKGHEISPDKVIPFDDDDDFEDWKQNHLSHQKTKFSPTTLFLPFFLALYRSWSHFSMISQGLVSILQIVVKTPILSVILSQTGDRGLGILSLLTPDLNSSARCIAPSWFVV